MALGPDAVRSTRKHKIEKLEEIIDEKIRESNTETVRIDADLLPEIERFINYIQKAYESAGWYTVELTENWNGDLELVLHG